MSNKLYDSLKWVAQYLLPALAALYFALAGIWKLPYAEEVMGTIMTLTTFLGVLLGLSAAAYANRAGTKVAYNVSFLDSYELAADTGSALIIKMSHETYETLKWVSKILLPALATAYFGLSNIWGFPYTAEVVGTLAALTAFMGAILGISSEQYKNVQAAKTILPDERT